MAGLVIQAVVHPGGSVHADLEAIADEEVMIVETFGGACEPCIANAESDDPEPPPFSGCQGARYGNRCRCKQITKTVSEIIRASV